MVTCEGHLLAMPAASQAAAAQMEGYDASDMAVLLDRATLAAARRQLALAPPVTAPLPAAKSLPPTARPATVQRLAIREPDLAAARQGFSPAAFWGVGRPADATAGVQASMLCALLQCISGASTSRQVKATAETSRRLLCASTPAAS